MMNIAENFEHVASLPPSEHPWKIHAFDHGIVLVNPDHPARFIRRDGTVEVLHGLAQVKPVQIQSPCIAKGYVAICASKLFQNQGGKS